MRLHKEMRFSSFLKLLAYSFVSIPWRCWEFWAIAAAYALFAWTSTAPAWKKAVCSAAVLALITLIVCLDACRRLVVAGKATDVEADAAWRSLFARRAK